MNDMERYKQFNTIITTLSNFGEMTISELASMLSLKETLLENSLELLHDNTELKFIELYPEDKEPDPIWKRDTPLNDSDSNLLSLTYGEKHLFDSVISTDQKGYDYSLGYMTKSSQPLKNNLNEVIIINDCINSGTCLSASYTIKSGKRFDMIIEPLSVIYYEFDNLLYLVGQYEGNIQVYRIERLSHVKPTNMSYTPLEDFHLEGYLAKSWGLENGEPVKVSIRFEKVGSVMSKLDRDLQVRKFKVIDDHDDHIIYHDDVIGINSFKRWLRSYGGAATVMEPAFLRQEMIDSARTCLSYYLDD